MGLYLRFLRPGRVSEVSLIGVVLLLLAVVSGGWVAETAWGADWFTLSKVTLSWCSIAYGLAASVLPVWLLLTPRVLTPRDYLSTFMKVGTIILLAIGILIARPIVEAPAISTFAASGTGPVFAGSLFPFLFITIACGALSGFHALISSGTTPKLLEKESQMRLIGYGGMLTESFVAIMALITAAQSVGEETIVSRTGGAPTLAFGMSEVLHQVFGGAGPPRPRPHPASASRDLGPQAGRGGGSVDHRERLGGNDCRRDRSASRLQQGHGARPLQLKGRDPGHSLLDTYEARTGMDPDGDLNGLRQSVQYFDRVISLYAEDREFLRAMFVLAFEAVKSTSPMRSRLQEWLTGGADTVTPGCGPVSPMARSGRTPTSIPPR